MTLPHIILGSGGHAKVLLNVLQLCEANLIGLVDIDPSRKGIRVGGQPVLGGDEVVDGQAFDDVFLINGVGSVRGTERRREIFARFKARRYRFANAIHPSAIIASDVQLGEGVQIMAGAVVQPGARLGDNCIINTGALVDHDCIVGAHVHVAPGATICGGVEIGDGCHLGSGSTMIQQIQIGPGAVVAAGAAVTGDVAAGDVVGGVPARPLERSK